MSSSVREASAALEAIAREIRSCTRCPLHEGRTHAVPGEGPPDAPLLFVGEGPGAEEDQQGRPFVGAAGRLLDRLLASIRVPREKVFITNTVRCRPPGNREPRPDEVAACLPYLVRQMSVLQPRVVCLLGATATRALLGSDQKLNQVHGRAVREAGRWWFATYHPAAALRSASVANALQEDFRRLRRLVDVEWGTEVPDRWKPGALQKIFADGEATEPVVVSEADSLRVTWDVGAVHPTFRTESALVELLCRFLRRQRKAQAEVVSLQTTDAHSRRVPPESPVCVHLYAEVRLGPQL
ncbi:MAG: uracil-DNA glycosylase [Armatimonadota bacterium]|nr:uracil-DNA glycosylase [Armatimonadota bacterium]MDW8156645.1 uracil-DNA glycosylase [Armatimonadota bacterium]